MKPLDIIEEQNVLLKGGPGSGRRGHTTPIRSANKREYTRDSLNKKLTENNVSPKKIVKIFSEIEERYGNRKVSYNEIGNAMVSMGYSPSQAIAMLK